ncbi:MAG: prepilin-type N-terminal cleavage/methylation domain-containing protein [Candidatus Paceibacterota bacterium]|jgi:type II secretory pathway pseudopilin PulG
MKKFLKKHNKKNKGFTLVETLVSISIFTMSILGLLFVLSNGISDTGYAKKKLAASYLAQEGIEYVRNQRDNAVLYNATSPQAGWDSFKTPRAISLPVSSSDFTGFTRDITIAGVSVDEVKVTSTVTWTQGSGSFNIVFTEELYNWVE